MRDVERTCARCAANFLYFPLMIVLLSDLLKKRELIPTSQSRYYLPSISDPPSPISALGNLRRLKLKLPDNY